MVGMPGEATQRHTVRRRGGFIVSADAVGPFKGLPAPDPAMRVLARIRALKTVPKPTGKWSTLQRAKRRRYGTSVWKANPLRQIEKPDDAVAFKRLPAKVRDRLVDEAPVVAFNPRQLKTNQPVVYQADLEHFVRHAKDPEPVIVLRTKAGLYVHNGNHRSTVALLSGKKVRAKYIDLSKVKQIDAYGTSEGARKGWQERGKGEEHELYVYHKAHGVKTADSMKTTHADLIARTMGRVSYDDVNRGSALIDHAARTVTLDGHPDNSDWIPSEVVDHYKDRFPGYKVKDLYDAEAAADVLPDENAPQESLDRSDLIGDMQKRIAELKRYYADDVRAEAEPWIGVDLDGTLAHYDKFEGLDKIGAPIPKMVRLIKMHLRRGDVVKIFTARVADDPEGIARRAIENWCLKVFGQKLPITNIKDQGMTKLYDDRAVGVEPNTGELKAVEEQKCPHCGSSDYVLLPADFETAKCQQCGKTWDHGIVDGINDPYSSSQDDGMEAYSDDEPRDERGRWTAGDTNTDRTKWHFGDYNANDKINGVPLKFAPKPDFSKLVNPDLHEEPMRVPKWAHASAGVVMIEPDHKVWVVTPENYYGSYRNTFPKGTVESGESLQETAVRETYEESGLLAKITGVLGDVQRGTSVARYYIGQRVGGSPAMAGEETYAVKLMDLHDRATDERLLDVRNKPTADSQVLDLVRQHLGIAAPPKEESQVPDAGVIMHQKTGGAQGSNAGGFYKGSDGVDRYVKFYKTTEQGQGEALANTIYRDLGVGAPKSQIFALPNGKQGFASEIIPGGKTLEQTGLTKQNAQEVMKGFAADVLTANWDAVGLTHDNILLKGNEAHRVDNGAAFLYRAQGAPKPPSLLNQATEIKSFFNPAVNYAYAAVAKKAGYQSVQDIPSFRSQVEKIVQLRDASGGWDKYLDAKAPYVSSAQRDKIVEMLNARTHALSDAAGIKASIAAYSENEPRNEKGEWTDGDGDAPKGRGINQMKVFKSDFETNSGKKVDLLSIGDGRNINTKTIDPSVFTDDDGLVRMVIDPVREVMIFPNTGLHDVDHANILPDVAQEGKSWDTDYPRGILDLKRRSMMIYDMTDEAGDIAQTWDMHPKAAETRIKNSLDYAMKFAPYINGKKLTDVEIEPIAKVLGGSVDVAAYSESEPRNEKGEWTEEGFNKEAAETPAGVYYHGTQWGVLDDVARNGLVIGKGQGAAAWAETNDSDLAKAGKTQQAGVYLTKSRHLAWAFAQMATQAANRKLPGAAPLMFKLVLPDKLLRRTESDEQTRFGGSLRSLDYIPKRFITDYSFDGKTWYPFDAKSITKLGQDVRQMKSAAIEGRSLKAQADSLLARVLGLLISAQTEVF